MQKIQIDKTIKMSNLTTNKVEEPRWQHQMKPKTNPQNKRTWRRPTKWKTNIKIKIKTTNWTKKTKHPTTSVCFIDDDECVQWKIKTAPGSIHLLKRTSLTVRETPVTNVRLNQKNQPSLHEKLWMYQSFEWESVMAFKRRWQPKAYLKQPGSSKSKPKEELNLQTGYRQHPKSLSSITNGGWITTSPVRQMNLWNKAAIPITYQNPDSNPDSNQKPQDHRLTTR